MLSVLSENGWDQLADHCRDITFVMHMGTELEDAFAKVDILWSVMNLEFECDWQLVKFSIALDDTKWM